MLDEEGKIIVDHTYQGFDQTALQQIKDYLNLDGRRNNMFPKGKNGRASVLAKLRRKQAEIAKRYGKPAQQMAMAEDMECRRK